MMQVLTMAANRPATSPAAITRRPKLSPNYGPSTGSGRAGASTLSQTELRQIVASVIG
ncbi:MAG TPA: hypothetical protein VF582_05280 [Allosphingosinicella sp.]